MTTGFYWNERCMWHDNGPSVGVVPSRGIWQQGVHVEEPETKRRMKNLLDGYGVTDATIRIATDMLSEDDLHAVHTDRYVKLVKSLSAAEGGDAGELAMVAPGSHELALLSASGVYSAFAAVLRGQVQNSYSLTRPPGHHAEPDRGRGFCIYSNIAIAVRKAQAMGLVGRVAIVDWDVHHGNGTEAAFIDDPSVLTISLHQNQLYPLETGQAEVVGTGAGEGYNVNIPLPAGSGGGAYFCAMNEIVVPALERFRPEALIVACGYDAAFGDPMGRMMLGPTQYRELVRIMMETADKLCGGRLTFAHEGGYSAFMVPFCGAAVLETLLQRRFGIPDPLFEMVDNVAGQDLQRHQAEAVHLVSKIQGL